MHNIPTINNHFEKMFIKALKKDWMQDNITLKCKFTGF